MVLTLSSSSLTLFLFAFLSVHFCFIPFFSSLSSTDVLPSSFNPHLPPRFWPHLVEEDYYIALIIPLPRFLSPLFPANSFPSLDVCLIASLVFHIGVGSTYLLFVSDYDLCLLLTLVFVHIFVPFAVLCGVSIIASFDFFSLVCFTLVYLTYLHYSFVFLYSSHVLFIFLFSLLLFNHLLSIAFLCPITMTIGDPSPALTSPFLRFFSTFSSRCLFPFHSSPSLFFTLFLFSSFFCSSLWLTYET